MKISDHSHMIIGTLLLLVCVYYYFNALQKDELLIESFEGKIGVDTLDYGSSPGSTIAVSPSSKISKCGRQALEINYDLRPRGYVYCAKGYDLYHRTDITTWGGGRAGWRVQPDGIAWGKYEAFSIYLRGIGIGKVAVDLTDNGGEMWRYTVNVGSRGWKKYTISFDDLSSRMDWQPPSAVVNKYIDYPFKSFQIEPKEPGMGTLYVDCAKFVEL